MWRTYQQFWNHQADTRFHFFTAYVSGVINGSHRKALCGKVAAVDYIDPREPREGTPERFYCKRCRALLAKQQKNG